MRSPTPMNTVTPPESAMLPHRSSRISTLHFVMDWKVVSWMSLAFSDEAELEDLPCCDGSARCRLLGVAVWQMPIIRPDVYRKEQPVWLRTRLAR